MFARERRSRRRHGLLRSIEGDRERSRLAIDGEAHDAEAAIRPPVVIDDGLARIELRRIGPRRIARRGARTLGIRRRRLLGLEERDERLVQQRIEIGPATAGASAASPRGDGGAAASAAAAPRAPPSPVRPDDLRETYTLGQ